MLLLLPLLGHAALLGGPATPYPTGSYDSASARGYFLRRPLRLASRAVEIGFKSASFAGALLSDALSGDEIDGPRAEERGVALTNLLVDLGPAFIKIGQSASVRSDLLPPQYVKALTSLQEDVPAFSSAEARDIIVAELGKDKAQSLIAGLSAEPIAAASLGQVFRGTYEGQAVAVKVQRPSITDRIALDMCLVREVVAPIAGAFGAPGDIAGIADAWGAGLVDELDYNAEARNAALFNEELAGSPLEGRVFAPAVVDGASSRRVLTTEWVEGERLDRTAATDDVPRLASLAMNTYMNMMLETGTLHCDPHPGNLLRTPDGRLCVLDWGLVTSLDSELRLTLIEHVAHIVARDYAAIPADLVKLGFVPAGQEQAALSSGVVDLLTETYSKRAEGGGFANFDVPALFEELQVLSADAGASIFQIPPYFAYIAKAFATLEGIGLSADPNYSILNETLPYISRRILTDPAPRMAGALETFVFGETKGDKSARVLDAERVGTLVDGARRYAAAAAVLAADGVVAESDGSGSGGGGGGGEGEGGAASAAVVAQAERAADSLLDLLAEDTPASRLVLEQVVLLLGASSRQRWSELRARSGTLPLPSSPGGGGGGGDGGGERSVLGTLVDPLGLFRSSSLVTNDARDLAALEAADKLSALAAELFDGASVGTAAGTVPSGQAIDQRELVSALARKAFSRRDDLQRLSRRVAVEALDQVTERLAARGS